MDLSSYWGSWYHAVRDGVKRMYDPSFTNHVWRISVDTDVLSDLVLRVEIGDSLDDPGLRISPGILDGELDFQVAQIHAVKSFGDVQHFRVRMTDVVEPRLIVEPHRVHHQIISLP